MGDPDFYNIVYPALGEKIVFIRRISPRLREKYTKERFKSAIIVAILDSASKKIQQSPGATAFVKSPFRDRDSYDFFYSVDHLEYRGTIYKNLRNNGALELFELHLSNDGFFYKDSISPDFPKNGQVMYYNKKYNRANSEEWYYMAQNSFGLVQRQLEILAGIFGLEKGWKIEWLYNSDVMRMEFILQNPKKMLRIELEPGFPEYDHRQLVRGISYEQLRKENQKQEQSF